MSKEYPTVDEIKRYIINEFEEAMQDNFDINPYIVAENVFHLISKRYQLKDIRYEKKSNEIKNKK